MKILLYNLNHGGKEGNRLRQRWPALIKTIKSLKVDVAILLECWDWNEKKEFKEFAQKLNFPFYYFSKSNTKHHIGLISKIKPTAVKKSKDRLCHSLLIARFDKPYNFSILGIHLSPKNESTRLKEAALIIKAAKKSDPAIIIGDFNSLSPLDRYNEKKLLTKFKEQKINKFGTNKLEVRVMRKFLEAGYIDIYKKQHPSLKIHHSVPSRCCQDADHTTKMRLDYALISKSLTSKIKSSKIIKNKLSDKSSDHYPLLLTYK